MVMGEKPNPCDQTFLQKHVAFFDRNQDGIVYPWETFQGYYLFIYLLINFPFNFLACLWFRAIGAGIPLSTSAALLINLALSQKTRPGKFPSPLLPIEVKNIQRAKHGSDTGVYDSQGRFVSSKFEEIFSKHARTHPNALTSDELREMLRANRVPKDYLGW
ncbi:putative peroxygenase 4 [Senna tora]|uniref:Putative peroxygenase 4 n=1 Tax=Senna tora TaxID=362788 RepID=A0A834SRH2_9FABA|nr:putative peroxygenase 4 [Senna tora]